MTDTLPESIALVEAGFQRINNEIRSRSLSDDEWVLLGDLITHTRDKVRAMRKHSCGKLNKRL
jgi:hypothetical protein